MRNLTYLLTICALVSVTTSVRAQMTYSTTGGNSFTPTMLSSVDLPDGSMLSRGESTGFIWSNDTTVVGGNGSLDCMASNVVNSDGMPTDGSGTCDCIDEDGDVWWVSFTGAMQGEWTITGGTGKYEGIKGGGTWHVQSRYPDGKQINAWEGKWTIPDHAKGMMK